MTARLPLMWMNVMVVFWIVCAGVANNWLSAPELEESENVVNYSELWKKIRIEFFC